MWRLHSTQHDQIFHNMLIICYVFISAYETATEDVYAAIDYSELATEAEKNKRDILNFLNKDDIRGQYQQHYDSLLEKLSVTQKRRGMTRRIVAGHNTSVSALPWQVSLRERTYAICGGSIITDTWVITAAHCILRRKANDLSVRVGSSFKSYGGEMYDVRRSIHHPNYISKVKIFDVGLIELYTMLRFSSKILPIGMISKDKKILANRVAIVSGWGKLKEAGPSATFLQATTIKTIAMKLCKQSGLDRKGIDPNTMFCAGSFTQPSPDACQGDSGGPIVMDGILIGVVSWGLGCARGNFPGVYTRLSDPKILDWLYQYLSQSSETGGGVTPHTS